MRALRAWLWSTVACAGILVALVSVGQWLSGGWSWHNVADMPVAFSAVFATVVAAGYLPVYWVVERVRAHPMGRRQAILIALVLSPVTPVLLNATFRERWEPLIGRLDALAGASVPFAFAGIVFAVAWTMRSPE